jgi:hypothetical protein
MREAANMGVWGGVSWSSNASLCAFVVVRSETRLEELRAWDAGDLSDAGEVGGRCVV